LYVEHTRANGLLNTWGHTHVSGPTQGSLLPSVSRSCYSNFSAVYSFRTGKRARKSSSSRSAFGIEMPKSRGPLIEVLADRKRFNEELVRVATDTDSGNSSASPNRSSRTDTGHLFSSLKTLWYPMEWEVEWRTGGSFYRGQGISSPFNQPTDGNLRNWSFAVTRANGLNQSARTKQESDVFASSAPDRQEANLLTTVVELLRGDIPSMLKDYVKLVENSKSVLKAFGSEYLNQQFAWKPLVSEATGVINTLVTADRALYYESYRRQRSWQGPSYRNSTEAVVIVNSNDAGTNMPGSSWYSGPATYTGIGFPVTVHRNESFSQDFRFSSRYTGLARPTARANYHNDRALDVMKRIGLVNDPRVLWDLTPYSWLADWATSIGSGLVNASTYSRQTGKYTVDYAYSTSQTVHSWEIRLKSFQLHSNYSGSRPIQGSGMLTTVSKNRSRANPFGFGVDLSGLSSSQFSILTALGLARSR